MSNLQVIRLTSMKSTFLGEFRYCENIGRGLRKQFFTKIHGRMFPRFVREFYSNLEIEYLTLTTQVKGVEVNINKEEFGSFFELPLFVISYTYDGPSQFKIFSLNVSNLEFMEDPIGEKKLPPKMKFLKANGQVWHYMFNRILFPKTRKSCGILVIRLLPPIWYIM